MTTPRVTWIALGKKDHDGREEKIRIAGKIRERVGMMREREKPRASNVARERIVTVVKFSTLRSSLTR